MRTIPILCAAVAIVFAVAAGGALATQQPDSAILRDIRVLRSKTWRYQAVMGVPRTPNVAKSSELARLRNYWRRRAHRVLRRFAVGPRHVRDWLCIHRYEGSWRDDGAPYYGGLQMNISFQRHYGRVLLRAKGTANHWTPLEQMWVAEKAYRSGRGFYPWPNTARFCGLI